MCFSNCEKKIRRFCLKQIFNWKIKQMIQQDKANLHIFSDVNSSKQLILDVFNEVKFQGDSQINKGLLPFSLKDNSSVKFSEKQTNRIVQLYLQNGSKWSVFADKLIGRSSRQIKNFFYNRLRKLAKSLCSAEKTKKLCQKKFITVMNLHCLLDTSLMVKKYLRSDFEELSICKIQGEVLKYSFFSSNIEIEQQELLRLAKNIREMKLLLKNIKIKKPFLSNFKVRKLSQKFLQQNELSLKIMPCQSKQLKKQVKVEQMQDLIAHLIKHQQKTKKQEMK